MYRKKKKKRSDEDREEIVGEATRRVVEMLRAAGVPIPDGLCLPGPTNRISSEEEHEDEERDVHDREYNEAPSPQREYIEAPLPEPDTIDLLTNETKCSLLDDSGKNIELAFATVFPQQKTCHTVPVQTGYAVVKPTYVWPNARHIDLPISVGDEITNLGEALSQWIQWPRKQILVPPRSSRGPNSASPSVDTTSDAGTENKQKERHVSKPVAKQQDPKKVSEKQNQKQQESEKGSEKQKQKQEEPAEDPNKKQQEPEKDPKKHPEPAQDPENQKQKEVQKDPEQQKQQEKQKEAHKDPEQPKEQEKEPQKDPDQQPQQDDPNQQENDVIQSKNKKNPMLTPFGLCHILNTSLVSPCCQKRK